MLEDGARNGVWVHKERPPALHEVTAKSRLTNATLKSVTQDLMTVLKLSEHKQATKDGSPEVPRGHTVCQSKMQLSLICVSLAFPALSHGCLDFLVVPWFSEQVLQENNVGQCDILWSIPTFLILTPCPDSGSKTRGRRL